jgi:hypothetical protein
MSSSPVLSRNVRIVSVLLSALNDAMQFVGRGGGAVDFSEIVTLEEEVRYLFRESNRLATAPAPSPEDLRVLETDSELLIARTGEALLIAEANVEALQAKNQTYLNGAAAKWALTRDKR